MAGIATRGGGFRKRMASSINTVLLREKKTEKRLKRYENKHRKTPNCNR